MTERLEYAGLFTDLEIGVVKNVINEVRRQWPCLEKEDFDDLLQSCLVKWWTVKNTYDENSGTSLSTYMAAVIWKHLYNLKENRLCDSRIISGKTVSLDQPTNDDKDSPQLIDRIPAPDYLHFFELKLTIQVSLSALSERQQELCRLLGEEGLSLTDAVKYLKASRMTVYRDIKRIRSVFEKQNLRGI